MKRLLFGVLALLGILIPAHADPMYFVCGVTANNQPLFCQVGIGPTGSIGMPANAPLDVPLRASAADAAATYTSTDQSVGYGHRGIDIVMDVTGIGAGMTLTAEVDYKDPASGKYVALLTGAGVNSNSTNIYKVFPGATAAANSVANDNIGHTFRVKVVPSGGSNPSTYSIGYTLLP